MPTIITHAAIPLTLGLGLGTKIIPPRLLLAGIAISMLPDADVLALNLASPMAMLSAIVDLRTPCYLPSPYPRYYWRSIDSSILRLPVSGYFYLYHCSRTACWIR